MTTLVGRIIWFAGLFFIIAALVLLWLKQPGYALIAVALSVACNYLMDGLAWAPGQLRIRAS